jgi:general secretion pathway protein A
MYYRHFSLSGPPFEAAPGPEALYLSRAHREGLAALEWGLLHELSGFTTLTGEAGTGKTSLVCSLLARNLSQLTAAYVINPKLPFEDILRVILGQFGVQCMGATKLDRIEALVGFLGRRTTRERLAIIVDEAQDLSDDALEELRLLSNYGRRIGGYLHLVLIGQPELSVRLNKPSLRQFSQRIAVRSVLSRLSFAEAHEYVDYRLRVKGVRSRDIFESDALSYLLRHANGIPRQINVLCHNAMLTAYSAERPRVDTKAVRAAVTEHRQLLLSDLWTSNLPSQRSQAGLVSVAALALVFAAAYGSARVVKDAPSVHENAQVTAVRESKVSSGTIAQRVSAGTSPHASAPPAPGAAADDRPQEALSYSPTTSFSSVQKTPTGDDPAIVLPAPFSIEPAPNYEPAPDHERGGDGQAIDLSSLPAEPKDDQKSSISVKYGDTLEKLAIKYLGSRYALNTLIDANPQITDVNKIYPGQTIYLSSAHDQNGSAQSPINVAGRH